MFVSRVGSSIGVGSRFLSGSPLVESARPLSAHPRLTQKPVSKTEATPLRLATTSHVHVVTMKICNKYEWLNTFWKLRVDTLPVRALS